MKLFPSNPLSSAPSVETIGLGSATAVHIVGAAILCVALGNLPQETTEAKLCGSTSAINLSAAWVEPTAATPPMEITPLDVEVMPDEVRVADCRYRQTEVTAAPTLRELDIVEQLKSPLPPPDIQRSEHVTEVSVERCTPKVVIPATAASRPTAASMPAVDAELATSVATLLNARPPSYPPQAIARRQEGLVMLRVHIAADGTVEKLDIVSSSGHRILDAAAVQAVRSWRFIPATCDGICVPSTERLPVRFSLDK